MTTKATRIESDFLGEMELPAEALYGLQSRRATENFPITDPFHREWYQAMGTVKLASYLTVERFYDALKTTTPEATLPKTLSIEKLKAIQQAASEIADGLHFDHFIVAATQGGAGTSINMNINEIVANRALQIINHSAGHYQVIHPIDDANLYQSTNDVVPTALRVAMMRLFVAAEESINLMRKETERLEGESRDMLRVGFTQMQEAVPSSYGRLFAAYNEALSRDWWRISKCFERIKVINLGGGAIGTANGVPRYFVMEASRNLQQLTGLPVTRSENLADATQNLDPLVEVHAILKTHAVVIEKIASDLRLLASDLLANNDVKIPERQIGSTIMPGKVNPVVVEFVISAAHQVYANDMLITNLAGQGCLDLNAYLPSIGNAILQSQKLLLAADKTLTYNLLKGITFNSEKALAKLFSSPAITTALVPVVGYTKASELARLMKKNSINVFEANKLSNLIDSQILEQMLQPDNLLKTGFSVHDIALYKNQSTSPK